ncbi:VOC family protein [Calothrix membranacea FACHB-236]|nr:VOC family protein [Calothrix membranacea FACHB-236]
MLNAINWFEIPAVDLERAIAFYSAVLGKDIIRGEFMGQPQGFFPSDREGVTGAIIKRDYETPSNSGALIYLNAGDNLDGAIAKVEPSGGKVVLPKTDLGQFGFASIIIDSEGNRIGLHSQS